MIKTKCDLNIYEKREKILSDTEECSKLLTYAKDNYPLDRDLDDLDDDSEDEKPAAEKQVDEKKNTFMKTEIPFIMKGTIDWINKRTKEKKNDKKFMERF